MNFIKYILGFSILTLSFSLTAQDDLPSGQVDVVKSFEARLAETNRLNVAAQMPPLDTTTRRLNYNVVAKDVPVEYLPPRIRPLAFRTEKPAPVYAGYARLGVGLPSGFLGEFSYDVTKSKEFDFGIDLRRHTVSNDKNVENQRFSNNEIDFKGTYYFDQGFAVKGNIGYTTNGVNYYGYNDLNEELGLEGEDKYSFDKDQVKQRFNIVDFDFSIFNGQRTQGDFNYSAGIKSYIFSDNYASDEKGFLLDLNAVKWFDEKHPLSIGLRTDFTNYNDTMKQTLNNFYLEPSFTYHADAFQVKVGANITSHDDNFSFFPDIEASANVVAGIATAYVGIDGSLQKNNLRSLTDYNPFIFTRIQVQNSKWTEYYGGVKGTIAGITYNGQVSYKNVDDLALFQIRDPQDSLVRFNVLYDTASIVTVKGSLTVPVMEGLEVLGSVSQSVYSMEREEKPWHLPSFTLNAAAKYTAPENLFTLRADMFLENGVPYTNTAGETENLNALFDISLLGEYNFNKNIGAWIQLNNIATNKRQRWFRYPTMGLNFLVGVKAKF